MNGFQKFIHSNVGFVLLMLVFAIVIGLGGVFGVFAWLKHYTQHGVEQEVPEIWGMYEEEARTILEAQGLRLQVIDSTYSNTAALGTIVEQNPAAGAKVKNGREIYVIINAREQKQVAVPDLHDISFRQAQAMLKAVGLEVEDIKYEPSEYRDLVLDVRRGEQSLAAGTRLQIGTPVVLVVGQGKGTEQVYIPDVTSKTLDEAREILLEARLVIGATDYDTEESNPTGEQANNLTDEQTSIYYIYQQTPRAGEWILEGSRIDLKLSTDPKKAAEYGNKADEEEFF